RLALVRRRLVVGIDRCVGLTEASCSGELGRQKLPSLPFSQALNVRRRTSLGFLCYYLIL
ncbi:hypothetical protein TorRG33x02_113990, partial [Trema orientale]